MKEDLLTGIRDAFFEYEDEELVQNINDALEKGTDAMEILECLSSALEEIGVQFSSGELFLPDMIMAGDMMTNTMGMLKPELMKSDNYVPNEKKILIGTVKGDLHDIGKNMVKMMFVSSGYEVIDLGTDVASEAFYEKIKEENPDLVTISSCMTTTVPSMKDTIDLLKAKGLDKDYKIVVGGGSVNANLAEEMGAYCYGGDDAYEALQTAKDLLSE